MKAATAPTATPTHLGRHHRPGRQRDQTAVRAEGIDGLIDTGGNAASTPAWTTTSPNPIDPDELREARDRQTVTTRRAV